MQISDNQLKVSFRAEANNIWIRLSDGKKFKFIKWIDNNFIEILELKGE